VDFFLENLCSHLVRWLDLDGMQHLKQSELVTVGDFFPQESYCQTACFSRKRFSSQRLARKAGFPRKRVGKRLSQTGPYFDVICHGGDAGLIDTRKII
jgi:hypothetical protein